MSKLAKLRRLSFDELRVRGAQFLNSTLERRGWSSLSKLPDDNQFFSLLNCGLTSAEQLSDHFRLRSSPRFFTGISEREATLWSVNANFSDSRDSIIEKANRIIAGNFDLLGLSNLSFGEPIDWSLEPVSGKRAPSDHWSRVNYLDADVTGDKKIIWELNRHQYFVTLGQAYLLSGNERYAETFANHLQSWMDQNPPKQGINWASSLEVSFRSISWIWALQFFRESKSVTPPLLLRALKFLYLNARHLETYLSTYFSPNTHLTGEALGLFYLGTMLPEFRSAKRWQQTGRRILLQQLPIHVQADGVYFEQSSYYHRYTTDFYLHFLILSKLNGEALLETVEAKLQLLLDHLMYITRPDGTTPLFGDDDGGKLVMLGHRAPNDFRDTLAIGAALFERGDYKFVSSDAAATVLWLLGAQALQTFKTLRSAAPAVTSKSFPIGGYYVMRDGWKKNSNFLLIDCGPHGVNNCGHAHADALSFELAAGGKNLFVDPGTFTYTGSEDMRNWFRGSSAHNTLTVDGQSSSVPAGPFSWQRMAETETTSWITNDRVDYFSGRHNGYERLADPVKHSREVMFLKQDYWIIQDKVRSAAEHRCDLWFHLDKGVATETAGEIIQIADSDEFRLKLASFGENLAPRAEEGWVSHCYAQRTLAPVLAFSAQAKGKQSFVTFLLPTQSSTVTEVEAIGGRAFEITGDMGQDVLLLRSEQRAEMARLASDFEWTWARFSDETATVPEELVLINGQWLELGGREILRSKRRINYLIATRVGDEFRMQTDDGVLQLQFPISDFESVLRSLKIEDRKQ